MLSARDPRAEESVRIELGIAAIFGRASTLRKDSLRLRVVTEESVEDGGRGNITKGEHQ